VYTTETLLGFYFFLSRFFSRRSLAKSECKFFIAVLTRLYEITMNIDGIYIAKLLLNKSRM
jgi:hypothetical protein